MKLLRLKINDEKGFRSLNKDFEIKFQNGFNDSQPNDFYPYVLAGQNGSGKSNVLEALAEIFYHLDCIYVRYKPENFDQSDENPDGFNPSISRINEYELEYYTFLDKDIFLNEDKTKKAHISIIKTKHSRPEIKWINENEFRDISQLSQQQAKSLLPKYVVGYASGNNETLSFPFIKSRFLQFDEYLSTLASKEFVSPAAETSLVYLDEVYSQAILLTNLLMLDGINDNDENDLLAPFKDNVGVEDVDTFRLIIRSDIRIFPPKNSNSTEDEKDIRLIQNLDLKIPEQRPNLTSYIEKLKSCATTWYTDYLSEFDDILLNNEANYLYLDFKVNKATKEAFQFHFEKDPLKLFELFQLLMLQDAYKVSSERKNNIYTTQNIFLNQDINFIPEEQERILRFKDFKIKKEGIDKGIFTKELSDGEHQLLHTLGLCLLYKEQRCLFLFDEPETHFNPDWKAKFITSIRNCFKDNTPKCEMLITTHSPYLISDSDKKHVRMFKKNIKDSNKITSNPPSFQTLGSSINKITIEIFGANITIGDYALSKLEKINERFKEGENPEVLLNELDEQLGDSVEKTLLKYKIDS
ncbi:restriction system-associated AAA family ATPase [Flavobacterium xueshanense]|uniref:Restriction system-associated AAA family ATPase n=1 Tax=Flavobacterium xueshanense TaxID=935223 RepID=A0A1I2CHE9_9FLAO|nr:restriction system-associated AAA family ATPase [Flavobacterium xueshanense]SFE67233.1 restriction system-associated AAA family ATPase [Flavobacterium xueshanense]